VCHSCSDKIDKDPERYPADVLHKWKEDHERWVEGVSIVPPFPELTLITNVGLVIGAADTAIDGQMLADARDHDVQLRGSSRHELHQLRVDLQFPETILCVEVIERPPGVEVRAAHDNGETTAVSGQVAASPEQGASNKLTVLVERVLPGRPVRLRLRSVRAWADDALRDAADLFKDRLATYATVTFLYRDGEHYFERKCVLPISSQGDRRYEFGVAFEDDGALRLVKTRVWTREVVLTNGGTIRRG
jgi:hypothetical protein